ncbi:MAG: alanine dehydrogenase [Bacteroidales bacterium]|jgi:alanine dehydrogenase
MEENGKPLSFFQHGMMPKEETLDREKKGKLFVIGLPKESDSRETRISLTPQAVHLLVDAGHRVLIERGAGAGAKFSDHDFSEAGGELVNDKPSVFEANIILKVSPLTKAETELLGPGKTIITSLQLATRDESYFQDLIRQKVTAIAFELIQDEAQEVPVLRSMCEIAGTVAVNIGSGLLSSENNGKGILLGGITGITPTEVVILGAGTAAENAARTALGMGAIVKVFDCSITNLRSLKHYVGQEIFTSVMHPPVLKKAFETADLVISTLQRLNQDSFFMISEDIILSMKPGSVLIDIHVDQGSSFETAIYQAPGETVFTRHGVVHYMVPNLPAKVARTASIALSNVLMPILLDKGRHGGILQLVKDDWGVRHGVYLYNGILTNELIGNQFGIPSKDIDLLLSAF